MMFFEKDYSRPYVAVRCYADVLINQDIVDDYSNETISIKQWLKFSTRIDKLEEFIKEEVWREDARGDDNVAAGRRVIGQETAVIIRRYAQANFREHGSTIAPSDRAVYINKIANLITTSNTEAGQDLVVLSHPLVKDIDRKEWIRALNYDIRHIDFSTIYGIWLICGDDGLSVTKIVNNFPDISLRTLGW